MKLRTTVVTTLLALVFSSNTFACGDSLYRVGKGVSYRTYYAPLPGNLLVFGTSESAKQLADELAKSGHDVRLVESAEVLAAELERGGYDVVIAPYSDHAAIESGKGPSSYLPIAVTSDEEKVAKQSYDTVMVPDRHEIKHYLKAIHLSLRNRA